MHRRGDGLGGTDESERALFEEAVSDARRLEHDRLVPHLSFRTPASISEREHEVLRELDALIAGESPFEAQDEGERIEGKVPGLDPRVLVRLRRGEFTVQADLDLHGVAAEAARVLVETFLLECRARGLRCVRIVHGRGRNSPDGIPVLKRSLPRWLARGPARHAALAYTTAAPKDGGAGASYVLLRRPL